MEENKKTKTELQKSRIDIEEIKKLAEEADKNKGFELGLEQDFEEERISVGTIEDVQNPEKSYKLYYAIEGFLRTHLPSGDDYKELRRFVREEKIIFLTGGKKKDVYGTRGADSRQAYISSHLEVALNALIDWLQDGGSTFDLFLKFRQLNIEYGYFSEEELANYDQSKQA